MFEDLVPEKNRRPAAGSGMFDDLVPERTSAARTIADQALSLGQGLVGSVKALADVAGTDTAVSRGLGGISEGIESLYSPGRKAEKRARQQSIDAANQSGSTLDQVTARLGGFAEAPAQTLLQGIGSMGPTLAAAVATRGRVLPAAGLGAAMGVGSVKGQNYDAVKAEALQRGMSAAEAEKLAGRASEYSIENLPQQALGGALGALDAGTGVERLAGNFAGGKQAAAGLLKRVGKGAAEEAVPEGLQGSQGQYAQNEALNRAGFQTDPMAGVVGAGVHDAAVGAVLGAAAGVPRGAAPTNAKPSGETEQPAGETGQAPGVTQPGQGETPATGAAPTPQAIRAQKLPETGPLSSAVNAGIEATARAAEPPMSEDDMAAALFHVETKRQDGTPQGARFAAEFDAGRISPREALEAFRLERSPEFTLPQPGVAAGELPLEEAAALAAQGDLEQPIPVGQATDLPVDVVEPAPPIPDDPRAARTPRADPAAIDPAAPNAVAQYIERLRAINTPAAQAFVRDFEAGRISPQVVLDAMLPRPQESADQRLQAAAARAPAPAPDAGIVIPERPRTLRDAQAKRAAEKAAQQQQEAASAPSPAQQPAAPGPAIAQQPASGPLTAGAQAAAPAQPPQVAGEPAGGAVGPAGEVAAPGARGSAEPRGGVGAVGAAGIGGDVAGPVDRPAGSPAASGGPAEPVAGGVRADGALIEHVTTKGKTIRGVIRTDLTQGEAIAIDSGTFKKDGPNGRGYFIRERSLDKLAEHDARKAAGGSATAEAPSVAAPEQPSSATPARRGVPTLEQLVEAYTAANGGGPLPENLRATAAKLHRALAEQGAQTVRDLSHPNNPKSRKVIEQLSGLKLPRGAEQSANIAQQWMASLHAKPVTPQVPAPASNAAAPVSTQAPAQAGATAAAAPATPTDPVKRRAVLLALRDCLAA